MIRFSMGAVAARSGLSPHTIRAWERRYGVLEPDRSGTNRRQYSEQDLERLILLRKAVEAGHPISAAAALSPADLARLTQDLTQFGLTSGGGLQDWVAQCERAMERLDGQAMTDALRRGAAALGLRELLNGVIVPLLDRIGSRWQAGTLGIAHEHLGSDVLRAFLHESRVSLTPALGARKLIVTTPSGQHHEIGALIVALAAALEGWSVIYLGPSLPASEISNAALQAGAAAVALSVVYPIDDPTLGSELDALRLKLGNVPVLVGGRGAESYARELDGINAHTIHRLTDLAGILHRL